MILWLAGLKEVFLSVSVGVFLLNRGLSAMTEVSGNFWDDEEVETDEEKRTSGLFPSLVPGVSPVKC